MEQQGQFRCTLCGRDFNSQNELREHERTHGTAGVGQTGREQGREPGRQPERQGGQPEEGEKKKGVGQ